MYVWPCLILAIILDCLSGEWGSIPHRVAKTQSRGIPSRYERVERLNRTHAGSTPVREAKLHRRHYMNIPTNDISWPCTSILEKVLIAKAEVKHSFSANGITLTYMLSGQELKYHAAIEVSYGYHVALIDVNVISKLLVDATTDDVLSFCYGLGIILIDNDCVDGFYLINLGELSTRSRYIRFKVNQAYGGQLENGIIFKTAIDLSLYKRRHSDAVNASYRSTFKWFTDSKFAIKL